MRIAASSSSSASASSASSTADAASDLHSSSSSSPSHAIGATIGSILGVLAVLVLGALWYRRRTQRRLRLEARAGGGGAAGGQWKSYHHSAAAADAYDEKPLPDVAAGGGGSPFADGPAGGARWSGSYASPMGAGAAGVGTRGAAVAYPYAPSSGVHGGRDLTSGALIAGFQHSPYADSDGHDFDSYDGHGQYGAAGVRAPSPTDYYGRALAPADHLAFAEQYGDDGLFASEDGHASGAAAAAVLQGREPTNLAAYAPMPHQLPPLSPRDFGSPLSGSFREPQQQTHHDDAHAAEALRQSYAELARAAQVAEPITPAAGSALMTPMAPEPYRHGQPLTTLQEVETPMTHASARNPFEDPVAATASSTSRTTAAAARASTDSLALPKTAKQLEQERYAAANAAVTAAQNLPAPPAYQVRDMPSTPTSASTSSLQAPSVRFPPPTPGVSLPQSPESYISSTPIEPLPAPGARIGKSSNSAVSLDAYMASPARGTVTSGSRLAPPQASTPDDLKRLSMQTDVEDAYDAC